MALLPFLHQFSDLGLLILRIAVGIIFLSHGMQKRAMWKTEPSANMSTNMLSIMRFLSVVEPLGGLAVLIGFLTQLAALGLSLIMIGAAFLKITAWHKKFSEPGGWELDIIILAATIFLLISGAGHFGIDILLFGF